MLFWPEPGLGLSRDCSRGPVFGELELDYRSGGIGDHFRCFLSRNKSGNP